MYCSVGTRLCASDVIYAKTENPNMTGTFVPLVSSRVSASEKTLPRMSPSSLGKEELQLCLASHYNKGYSLQVPISSANEAQTIPPTGHSCITELSNA